jgi:Fic family protein
MSAQIQAERKSYYEILETTQKGSLDITEWLIWFLDCLERAFNGAEIILADVLVKARFWEQHGVHPLNDRHRKTLNRFLDGFEGHLTSSKWTKLGKCSQDTAFHDIGGLIKHGILVKNPGGGRSTTTH